LLTDIDGRHFRDQRYGRDPKTGFALRPLDNVGIQYDRWLSAIADDSSSDPAIVKIRRAKLADLVDACWTRGGSGT